MEKDWIKLDNAALIYPATVKRQYATMFRLTVTLKDDIDTKVLQQALNNIMKRFPTFNYSLRQGFFWYYFNKMNRYPIIESDSINPLIRKDFSKRFLFRVRVYKNRLAIDYFHALTDGTGGITFLLTLTSEYLRLKNNLKIKYSKYVLNPNDTPTKDEVSDSFLKYARKGGALEHEKKAYHIKGTNEQSSVINIITGKISISKLKTITKKYNSTITEFIVSVLLYSLSQMANTKKQFKVSVPINLRNIYETNTLRNFSSYVNIGIDGNKEYTLDEIISIVKKEMKTLTNEKRINAKISGNVKLMKNELIRRIPMFIKRHVMSLAERIMGDGYITTTFSNLGLITVQKEVEEYITDMNFILGNSKNKSGSIAAIGYKDNLYISFSRKIKESEFERLFFTNLSKMGLDIDIESNR